MALTTPKMLLRIWDQLSDLYSHDQMADNWSKIDLHDHTPGRGAQIPTEGIFDGAVTSAKLAPSLDPSPGYTAYKYVNRGFGAIAASTVAGTYALGPNAPISIASTSQASSGSINSNAQNAFYVDPADYAATGRTTSFRMRGWGFQTSVTASTIGCTFQLIQYASMTSGTGFITPTVVASVVLAAPPQNALTPIAVTVDFTLPSAGFYVFAAVTPSTSAAGSIMLLGADLHVRQV